jgi:hypothetical protein
VEPFSLAIEGASLAVAVIPLVFDLFRNLRNHSKYESLEKTVSKRDALLKKMYWETRPQDWERVITLLDVSDEMMPLVVERLKRRFTLLFVIAVPIVAISALTLRPQAGFTPTNITDVALLLINFSLPFFNFQARPVRLLQEYLFNTDEKAFLKNVSLLRDEFYEHSVRGTIKAFNDACGNVKRLEGSRKVCEFEMQRLKTAFKAYLTPGDGPH